MKTTFVTIGVLVAALAGSAVFADADTMQQQNMQQTMQPQMNNTQMGQGQAQAQMQTTTPAMPMPNTQNPNQPQQTPAATDNTMQDMNANPNTAMPAAPNSN